MNCSHGSHNSKYLRSRGSQHVDGDVFRGGGVLGFRFTVVYMYIYICNV